MELPLVKAELNRSGRRASTYILRTLAPGTAFAVFAMYYQVAMQPEFPLHVDDVGQHFVTIELIMLALVLFLGLPFIGAVQIAQEKHERTLGLLLLADQSGHDVFLAKYLSVMIYGLCLVASGVPILMLSVYFGVTTAASIAFQGTLLIIIVFAITSLSMLCSTIAPDPRTALFATFVCIAAFMALSSYAQYLWLFPMNPLHLLFLTPDSLQGRIGYLVAYLAAAVAAAAACTIAAIRAFPRQAYTEIPVVTRDGGAIARWRWLEGYIKKPSAMAALLQYAMAPPGFGPDPRTRRRSLVGLSALALVTGPLMLPLLAVLIIFDVASNMRSLFVHGVLDDVRLLPIDEDDVGASLHEAQRHRALSYLGPALCSGVGFLMWLTVATVLLQSRVTQQGKILDWLMLFLCGAAYFYVSLWLIRCLVSLTCDCARKENRVARVTAMAVTTVAGYVVAAGYVGMFVVGAFVGFGLIAGVGYAMEMLIAVLGLELLALYVLRRTARDYERTFLRLFERDIHVLAERNEG